MDTRAPGSTDETYLHGESMVSMGLGESSPTHYAAAILLGELVRAIVFVVIWDSLFWTI